jgi:hypothetical protein
MPSACHCRFGSRTCSSVSMRVPVSSSSNARGPSGALASCAHMRTCRPRVYTPTHTHQHTPAHNHTHNTPVRVGAYAHMHRLRHANECVHAGRRTILTPVSLFTHSLHASLSLTQPLISQWQWQWNCTGNHNHNHNQNLAGGLVVGSLVQIKHRISVRAVLGFEVLLRPSTCGVYTGY